MLKLAIVCALGVLAARAFPQTAAPPAASPSSIVCSACARDASAPAFPPRKTILGQHVDVIGAQIAYQSGVKPFVLQTSRTTLVAAIEGGVSGDLDEGELAYVKSLFPALRATPGALDAHQEAHVLAYRILAVENDVGQILALDDRGRVRPESSPTQVVASGHVELFVFSKKTAYDTFTSFLFDRGVWPLGGAMLDSGPTSAMVLPSLKDPAARRQIAFTSAMLLARGLSRAAGGLQGWLQVGLAHVIEDRHSGNATRAAGATLPPGSEIPKDWDAFVADLVVGGKVGDLGALAATPAAALSVRSRLQSWSLVRFLIAKDGKKFATLVRTLLHAPSAESPTKALLGALRPAFDHDLVSIVDEWKKSATKSRASK